MTKNEQERQRIGRRIAEIRKTVPWTDEMGIHRTGMTQMELARRAGIRQSNLSRIECGAYAATIDILATIIDAMGYEIDFVTKQ